MNTRKELAGRLEEIKRTAAELPERRSSDDEFATPVSYGEFVNTLVS